MTPPTAVTMLYDAEWLCWISASDPSPAGESSVARGSRSAIVVRMLALGIWTGSRRIVRAGRLLVPWHTRQGARAEIAGKLSMTSPAPQDRLEDSLTDGVFSARVSAAGCAGQLALDRTSAAIP